MLFAVPTMHGRLLAAAEADSTIAAALREGGEAGLPGLRAIGLELPARAGVAERRGPGGQTAAKGRLLRQIAVVQDPGGGMEGVGILRPALRQQGHDRFAACPVPRSQGDPGGLARRHRAILGLILGQQPDEGGRPIHGQASAPPKRSDHSATCVSSILLNSTAAARSDLRGLDEVAVRNDRAGDVQVLGRDVADLTSTRGGNQS
jgi:hypothetical protein